MDATLLTFVDKYYEYGGGHNINKRGLTIGDYESAWLADLVASFILKKTKRHFKDALFSRIYQDDGITIDKGKWSKQDIDCWLSRFQSQVDAIAGSSFLQFTVVVWDEDKEDGSPCKQTMVESRRKKSYQDAELFWIDEQLQFSVHLKENQELKYLNKGSTHTSTCFRVILRGVLG